MNGVLRDFKLAKVKKGIEAGDTGEFWRMVQQAAAVALGDEGAD
jgi:hypothetical protein